MRSLPLVLLLAACQSPPKAVVLRGTVLLPEGPTVGEVFIDATGLIVCAAASCETEKGYAAAKKLELGQSVISPGLINSHDHSSFATTGPQPHALTRYLHRHDWRVGAEGATALPEVLMSEDPALFASAELRMVIGGATSIVSSGEVRGLLRNLAAKEDRFREGLTGPAVNFDTFPLGDADGTLITSGCAYPKVRSAKDAFAAGAYSAHLAEGINAAAQNELTCAAPTLLTGRTALIHGVGLTANDVDVVRQSGAKLVWSPRSNISLYGDTAPVTVLRNAGVPIALGTDWLASGSMNMLRELACADSLNRTSFNAGFTDQALWEMATRNGALAAGFDSQVGALVKGMQGDVAVFDATTNGGYRAVVAAGVEDVQLVLRGGRPLYGDAALVSALQDGCSALDVCGVARKVCFEPEGESLEKVKAVSPYPLFFCRGEVPTDEPSCAPRRDAYPNGVTALDGDGDGVVDVSDDCPLVFNPPRPLDGAAQSDVDGDGFGDACDLAPLNAAVH